MKSLFLFMVMETTLETGFNVTDHCHALDLVFHKGKNRRKPTLSVQEMKERIKKLQ